MNQFSCGFENIASSDLSCNDQNEGFFSFELTAGKLMRLIEALIYEMKLNFLYQEN